MEEFLKQLQLQVLDGYRYHSPLSTDQMAAVAIYTREPGLPTTIRGEPPTKVVVKFLIAPRWERDLEAFRREAETLMMLRKQGYAHTIVKALTTVRSSTPFPVHYFFMEYVQGKTLRSLFEKGNLPWDSTTALDYLRRIALALLPAAGSAEVHRDLHAGNIMEVEPTDVPQGGVIDRDPGIRILDFGTSRNWLSAHRDNWFEDRFRHCGAISSWSPELLEDPARVESKHDVWALGNLFYMMLTGEHAYHAENFKTYYELVSQGNFNRESLQEFPNEMKRLISGMFEIDQRRRLSLAGVHKIATDILENNLGDWLQRRPMLQEFYFIVEGNIWTCPLCKATGNPDHSRCRACGRYVDEFESPF